MQHLRRSPWQQFQHTRIHRRFWTILLPPSPAAASSPVSSFSLPSSLALHHTASRQRHLKLKSDPVAPLPKPPTTPSSPAVTVFTMATAPRAICPPPPLPVTHSAPAKPLSCCSWTSPGNATRHVPTSRPWSHWLLPSAGSALPPDNHTATP